MSVITEFSGTDGATRANFNAKIQEANVGFDTLGNITLTCSKSSTVFALTGLSASSGLVSCVFKADADYVERDTFTIDGTAVTAQLQNGESLPDEFFRSGAVVPFIYDAENEKINFSQPDKLPNPSALTVSQGYGGQTGTYDGSAAVSISVPKITFHTSDPDTVADGELWAVYST